MALGGLATAFHPRRPDFIARILRVGYVIEKLYWDRLTFPVIIRILPCQLLPINISNTFLYHLGDGQWVH